MASSKCLLCATEDASATPMTRRFATAIATGARAVAASRARRVRRLMTAAFRSRQAVRAADDARGGDTAGLLFRDEPGASEVAHDLHVRGTAANAAQPKLPPFALTPRRAEPGASQGHVGGDLRRRPPEEAAVHGSCACAANARHSLDPAPLVCAAATGDAEHRQPVHGRQADHRPAKPSTAHFGGARPLHRSAQRSCMGSLGGSAR